MKFYRVVATLLVLIFLTNTTLFAAGQLEIVPAEKKSTTKSSDQFDSTSGVSSEQALKQVTLPNGRIKNPKLPKTFSIDDSTIYLLKPIPVDSEESFEADANSNPDLILVPVDNKDVLTVELNSEQPENKELSDILPKSEQSAIPTIISVTESKAEEIPEPITITTPVVENTPESVTLSVPETVAKSTPITTPIPVDTTVTDSTGTKESPTGSPQNTVITKPDTVVLGTEQASNSEQFPVDTVTTSENSSIAESKTMSTPENTTSIKSTTESTSLNTTPITSTTSTEVVSKTPTTVSSVPLKIAETTTSPIVESDNQAEIQSDNITSIVDIPVQETEVIARSVYEEPEIEVYSDSIDENSIQSEPLTINRKVSVKTNQYLDVYCDGRGWIYLGEINNNDNVIYNSKKTENGDTKFTFRTNSPGVSVLHLYKQDIIANSWIDDYCEVTVLNEKAPNPKDRVTVPITTEPTTNIEVSANSFEQSSDDLNIQDNSDNIQANSEQSNHYLSDEDLLKQAEQLFVDKQYIEVITVLNKIKNKDENLERKLFLEAQTYEAKSDIQNIQKAYNLYKELITDFPQSKKYQQAKARMQYINNYYFSIR